MKVRSLLACVAALALIACDGGTTDPDAGRDGGGGGMDAGGGGDDAGGGGDDAGGGGDDDAGGGMDAGGDDAGGGGDDGGMMMGDDAGMIGGCAPAPITIGDDGDCTPVAACDAPLVGAWCYTGICIERDELIPNMMFGVCSTDTWELRDPTGTVVGRVEFTATTVTRQINTHVMGTIHVPDGPCTLAGCTPIETGIRMRLPEGGSVSCTQLSDDSCDCALTLDTSLDTTDTYMTDGAGGLRVGTGPSARTWDYCVDSGTLSVDETSAMGSEPGIHTLAPET